jgi:hypothetical protein
MQESRLQYLFNNYLDKRITSPEKEELMSLIAKTENDELIRAFISKVADETGEEIDISDATANTILTAIIQADKIYSPSVHRIHFLKTSWFRYAAAVLLLIGGGTYIYLHTRPSDLSSPQGIPVASANDIQPGGNKAILTVGNQVIDLSSDKTGIAVNNTIAYTDGEKLGPSAVIPGSARDFLQLTTPRGGQYQAVLPDGSKVWLNAASSIKFPSKFTGANREVEVTGEVYLEIAKNTKQPFRVKANGTEIHVLGTSFNINAYTDEAAVKTTLIDGSVRVSLAGAPNSALLIPGQQALVSGQQQGIEVQAADVQQALAWKNGLFNFNNADLPTVMRQLERWYDITVKYEGNIPSFEFRGGMDRKVNLSAVLKFLENMQVKYRMNGRTLIISA